MAFFHLDEDNLSSCLRLLWVFFFFSFSYGLNLFISLIGTGPMFLLLMADESEGLKGNSYKFGLFLVVGYGDLSYPIT